MYVDPEKYFKCSGFWLQMEPCLFCSKVFSSVYTLRRHQLSFCKEKFQTDLEALRTRNLELVAEIHRLRDENDHISHELDLQRNRNLLQEERIEECQSKIEKLENQIFEIAKQPTTATTTTTVMTANNQRTVNILNQLGSYEFDPETIARALEEKFTKEVFQGGPDKIAELTAELLLHDAEQKPKVVCTDISRRTFRYIDPMTQKLETDPGFLKTHSLLKRPLFEANLNVFSRDFMRIDDDEDTYRNQWKLNDDFISNPTRFPEKLYPFLSRR